MVKGIHVGLLEKFSNYGDTRDSGDCLHLGMLVILADDMADRHR
jgi:hypothetical protein